MGGGLRDLRSGRGAEVIGHAHSAAGGNLLSSQAGYPALQGNRPHTHHIGPGGIGGGWGRAGAGRRGPPGPEEQRALAPPTGAWESC